MSAEYKCPVCHIPLVDKKPGTPIYGSQWQCDCGISHTIFHDTYGETTRFESFFLVNDHKTIFYDHIRDYTSITVDISGFHIKRIPNEYFIRIWNLRALV